MVPPGAEPAYKLNEDPPALQLHLVEPATPRIPWKTALSSGPATDDSGHEIQATRFFEITFTPEDCEIIDYLDTDGNNIQIPRYMVRMAEAIDESVTQGRYVVELGEGSSALKLFAHSKNAANVDVMHMQTLGEGDPRFNNLIRVNEDETGQPKSIFVPGGASITAINPYLKENYGSQYIVDFAITALSQLGANIPTSGKGGNRKIVPATKLWVKDETAGIRVITDPKEIAAYFGSQGYAGNILGMELEVTEVPKEEEVIMVSLSHQSTRDAYMQGVARLLAALYEYNVLNKRPDQIQLTQVELMDRSGTEASERTQNGTLDLVRKFNEDYLQGRALSLMLQVRHNFPGGLEQGYAQDDPQAEHFMGQLMTLIENGTITDIKFLLDDAKSRSKIQNLKAVREGMTHDARKEGDRIVAEGGGSTSQDDEIRFHIDVDPNDPEAVEATRANVLEAIQAVLEIHMDEYEEVLALNDPNALQQWFHTLYGHLSLMGLNIHDRKAGPNALKIKSVSANTHKRLMALDGKKFGNVTLKWTRGEKEKPDDEPGLKKALESDPEGQTLKFEVIKRGGETFGYRIKPATKKVAMEAGISL